MAAQDTPSPPATPFNLGDLSKAYGSTGGVSSNSPRHRPSPAAAGRRIVQPVPTASRAAAEPIEVLLGPGGPLEDTPDAGLPSQHRVQALMRLDVASLKPQGAGTGLEAEHSFASSAAAPLSPSHSGAPSPLGTAARLHGLSYHMSLSGGPGSLGGVGFPSPRPPPSRDAHTTGGAPAAAAAAQAPQPSRMSADRSASVPAQTGALNSSRQDRAWPSLSITVPGSSPALSSPGSGGPGSAGAAAGGGAPLSFKRSKGGPLSPSGTFMGSPRGGGVGSPGALSPGAAASPLRRALTSAPTAQLLALMQQRGGSIPAGLIPPGGLPPALLAASQSAGGAPPPGAGVGPDVPAHHHTAGLLQSGFSTISVTAGGHASMGDGKPVTAPANGQRGKVVMPGQGLSKSGPLWYGQIPMESKVTGGRGGDAGWGGEDSGAEEAEGPQSPGSLMGSSAKPGQMSSFISQIMSQQAKARAKAAQPQPKYKRYSWLKDASPGITAAAVATGSKEAAEAAALAAAAAAAAVYTDGGDDDVDPEGDPGDSEAAAIAAALGLPASLTAAAGNSDGEEGPAVTQQHRPSTVAGTGQVLRRQASPSRHIMFGGGSFSGNQSGAPPRTAPVGATRGHGSTGGQSPSKFSGRLSSFLAPPKPSKEEEERKEEQAQAAQAAAAAAAKKQAQLSGTSLSKAALARVQQAEQMLQRLQTPGMTLGDDNGPSNGGSDDEVHEAGMKQRRQSHWGRLGALGAKVGSTSYRHHIGLGHVAVMGFVDQVEDQDEYSLVVAARNRARQLHAQELGIKLSDEPLHRQTHSQALLNAPISRAASRAFRRGSQSGDAGGGVGGGSMRRRSSQSGGTSLYSGPPGQLPANAGELVAAALGGANGGAGSSGGAGESGAAAGLSPILEKKLAKSVHVEEPAVFTGIYGGPTNIRRKLEKQRTSLVKANPAAFSEDHAAQAEAEYRSNVEHAKHKYKEVMSTTGVKEKVDQEFFIAVKTMSAHRPYFAAPSLSRDKVQRRQGFDQVVVDEEPPWTLPTSIFAPRQRENEARDFYDNERVKMAQFALDWHRVAGKTRFRRLIQREDKAVKESGERLELELAELREECTEYKDVIRALFSYYSMTGGEMRSEDVLQMRLLQWLNFCSEATITDTSGQRGTMGTDLQNVFVAVNFEEEDDTIEAAANDDDAMMRFEFMEGIIRASIGKFITGRKCDDASDALHMLFEDVIIPSVPKEALVDPNDFRRDRLYCEEMDDACRDHWPIMQAMFKLFKAKDRTKWFQIEHWQALLEATKVMGTHTGVERREAKLLFVWSQMIVSDELKRRKRATALAFFDFVEALARLADLLSPPTETDLDAFFREHEVDPKAVAGNRLVEYYRVIGHEGHLRKRASAELVAQPTRPLFEKFDAMMDYMVHHLRDQYGGRDAEDCASRMMKMASMISGGIELG